MRPLRGAELEELETLRHIMLGRRGMLAGRTLWLGGTELARKRESSMSNCSFTRIMTVNDMVDAFWLLLQGCGVGFKPKRGSLYGFLRPLEIEVIPSERHKKGGDERNWEFYDAETGEWTVRVGDSAEAWAKSFGKILAHPWPAKKLILDFSQVRPAGGRLKGYGWICNGWEPLRDAYLSCARLLNERVGEVLTELDILDLVNLCGTVLSSRRSAQIALLDADNPLAWEFATAKKDHWQNGLAHRGQSNNSLIYWCRPTLEELKGHFETMVDAGGSEPGIINGEQAARRAPYYGGTNPCSEILLPDKGFCNLVTLNVSAFNSVGPALKDIQVLARANYRQTCTELRDGVLQDQWHHNNNFLRLCGVSLTGQVLAPWLDGEAYRLLRKAAHMGANSMADELGLPRSANITTVKPEGTISKVLGTTEGIHTPAGRYVFNNISFSKYDPAVAVLREGGYEVVPHPLDGNSVLITFPTAWDVPSHLLEEGAIDQLSRYRGVMDRYVDHNCSITVTYKPEELDGVVEWLHHHWDDYVGVSFLPRQSEGGAEALGYSYLPQEVVDEDRFRAYSDRLRPVELQRVESEVEDECAGGVCPVR